MQTVSEAYRALAAAETARETRLTVAGAEYGETFIGALRTAQAAWGGSPKIGQCVSAEIDAVLTIPSSAVPRMAELRPAVRLTDGAAASEWIPKGVFFVDTRVEDEASGTLTLHGYDAMLKTERAFTSSGDQGSWPMADIDAVKEICARIGVALDSRTEAIMTRGYSVEYPGYGDGAYTMREVLGFIGAMYAGNWVITDAGALRLLVLGDIPDESYYLVEEHGDVIVMGGVRILHRHPPEGRGSASNTGRAFLGPRVSKLDTSPAFAPFSKVVVTVGEDDEGAQLVYEAGDESGRTLETEIPWGTQEIADNILAAVRGYVYQPYTAENALLDPAAELGDAVTVGGKYSVIASMDTTFDALFTAYLSAPSEEEIDHEYPYESGAARQIERKIAKNRTSLIAQNGLIRAEVARAAEAEGELDAQISMTAEQILSTVSASGTWYLGNYKADAYGYGEPDPEELKPSEHDGKYYLDQTSGKLYQSNGTAWKFVADLTSVQSEISQHATAISSKITSDQAQTQINQTLNNIELSVSSESDGSSISMSSEDISVSSKKVDLHVKALNVEGEITAGKLKIYGDKTDQRSEMTATGLNVYNASGAQKVGMGWASGATEYPYLMLGQGTGYSGSGAGLVQKLGDGIWIGDAAISQAGGNYPGGASSASDISGSYPQATGLFIDFSADKIYKYVNGVPSELGEAVFG